MYYFNILLDHLRLNCRTFPTKQNIKWTETSAAIHAIWCLVLLVLKKYQTNHSKSHSGRSCIWESYRSEPQQTCGTRSSSHTVCHCIQNRSLSWKGTASKWHLFLRVKCLTCHCSLAEDWAKTQHIYMENPFKCTQWNKSLWTLHLLEVYICHLLFFQPIKLPDM